MTLAGGEWSVSLAVPWATQVIYKFHITYDDGRADSYLPDPTNPMQVDDGFGGKNSVFTGTTCDAWTCASTQISCSQGPVPTKSFDWRDAVIYWAFVDPFNNGDAGNDARISDRKLTGTPPTGRAGTGRGYRRRSRDGYF
jgi:hypothetical protein